MLFNFLRKIIFCVWDGKMRSEVLINLWSPARGKDDI